MPGLREQWRRAAMHTITERALDLFDERGFDAVTIEQIAAAAEVSPSSVYRYFGTKEGLLVADDFDGLSDEDLATLVDPADPVGSLLGSVLSYEAGSDGTTAPAETGAEPTSRRRVRYFFSEASVRMAALATLDRAAKRIAPFLAPERGLSPTQAHVVANALAFGYFAALERWFTDGGTRPIAEYVEEGMRPLRAIWVTD
ncbi:TetR/AcrR family transcriptional regulator; helix-turn-helix transcriptional regulator [Occultella gossypii]|uniref:Helix-turn-helix transcriptional regulator n=1 Tax=Occultella gossypii TaxID=2800820 RepID=A0ABS7SDS7_9MICO|nr:TetR/AcrR family transcriptional regulator; helix-turn-helix transcriptional regulator [Occultella gossypii]MBZ2198496.1 helix-turn-helix transcriptional regulator [Occultella gossypii]